MQIDEFSSIFNTRHRPCESKRVLLSSTLPNNEVNMALRIFLIHLTQLDSDFKAYLNGQN